MVMKSERGDAPNLTCGVFVVPPPHFVPFRVIYWPCERVVVESSVMASLVSMTLVSRCCSFWESFFFSNFKLRMSRDFMIWR